MNLSGKVNLTYCTNIHSERTWEDLFVSLQELLPSVKKKVSPDKAFGVGLRLSDHSARELLEDKNLLKLKEWLDAENLYVFTMNGFPYGRFHQTAVKDNVHKPDWTTRERVEYTIRLFRILTVLLPEKTEGGISTSPLSYKPWHIEPGVKLNFIYKKVSEHLALVVEELLKIKKESGKIMHLDIEPEPDGLIENSNETIAFFEKYLIPHAGKFLMNKLSLSEEEAKNAILEHIRICYDLCHFALQYENHEEAIKKFSKAGIKIGKVQLSSALKYRFGSREENNKAFENFDRLNEKTYLHQVVQMETDGSLTRYTDLPIALNKFHNHEGKEWRVHFHVPLFSEKFETLETTQNDVKKFLNLIPDKLSVSQLEVETYTWEVMPGELKLDLIESITKELEWVKGRLEVKQTIK